MTSFIEENASRIIADAIDLLSDKVTRYGREQRQLWIVLAANGFMKAKKDPEQKLVHMQEAVDKITRPYYKIMACQEDAPTAVSSGPLAGRADVSTGFIEYLPTGATAGVGEGVKAGEEGFEGVVDPPLLDLDEIAAWTFEDWNFNTADFQRLGTEF